MWVPVFIISLLSHLGDNAIGAFTLEGSGVVLHAQRSHHLPSLLPREGDGEKGLMGTDLE